jgi:hypothetical protein
MDIYTNKNIFYVYAYLRSKDSSDPKITDIAIKGTLYYIGKGCNGRAYRRWRSVPAPKDKSNIIFIGINMSEYKAFEMEKFLIAYYGRIDLGTGILRNRTDGGEGSSGYIVSKETRMKKSAAWKGENNPMYGKSGINSPRYGKPHSEETKAKMSAVLKGRQFSNDSKAKMSAAQKRIIHPIVECPHCGKRGKDNVMARYHFNNCKIRQ